LKILVTGGCGFIGSHLVDMLAVEGHDVIVVDDCSANNEKFFFLILTLSITNSAYVKKKN
jgi:nucleoside-diphosphate-sugar epimerase